MSAEGDPLPPVPDDFTSPQLSDSRGSPWTVEQYKQTALSAGDASVTDRVSGIWFPGANIMVVTPRRLHHNEQLYTLDQSGRLDEWGEAFVPWLVVRDEVDFPRSAGGASQYVSRNDIPPEYVRDASRVDEGDVYAVAYTCRRLGIPGDTETNIDFLPTESRFAPGTRAAREAGVVESSFRPLRDFYRELKFARQFPNPAF